MKKKTIILSYDYELFFGKCSGTVKKTIIEPTETLMSAMENCGLRGNFFVDYLMFWALENQNDSLTRRDLQLLKRQVADMVLRGHRVELHLHPHWIDAKYNGDGTWDFSDFTHYSLSSLDEQTIMQLFKDGAEYLNNLAQEIIPDYRVCAFRAGGWAVQPFDKLKKAFKETGLSIDSSTSHGIYKYMIDSYYDFRDSPNKSFYFFNDDVCKEESNGEFREVPITSFHRNLFLVLIDRLYSKRGYFKSYADGTHDRSTFGGTNLTRTSFWERFSKKHKLMFSLSMQSPLTILSALFFHKKQCLYCYIDHPKDLSRATLLGIRLLGRFCETKNYIDYIGK